MAKEKVYVCQYVEQSELASHLERVEEELRDSVLGQNEAISGTIEAIQQRLANTYDAARPAVFLAAGPSGVGKTLTAQQVAKHLFVAEEALNRFLRIDCTRFTVDEDISCLLGSAPGLVRSDRPGELTAFLKPLNHQDAATLKARLEKLKIKAGTPDARRLDERYFHTSCVILFDEVDKCPPSILVALMNFFDTGKIRDSSGVDLDATRAVIVLTTNCGADKCVREKGATGRVSDEHVARVKAAVRQDVLNGICAGHPELLARFTDVLVYWPFDVETRTSVVRKQLCDFAQLETDRHQLGQIEIDQTLFDYVALDRWRDREGARSSLQFIRNDVRSAWTRFVRQPRALRRKGCISFSYDVQRRVIQIGQGSDVSAEYHVASAPATLVEDPPAESSETPTRKRPADVCDVPVKRVEGESLGFIVCFGDGSANCEASMREHATLPNHLVGIFAEPYWFSSSRIAGALGLDARKLGRKLHRIRDDARISLEATGYFGDSIRALAGGTASLKRTNLYTVDALTRVLGDDDASALTHRIADGDEIRFLS
jgi:MoxR-like ATPase